jgi:hypothetical protein
MEKMLFRFNPSLKDKKRGERKYCFRSSWMTPKIMFMKQAVAVLSWKLLPSLPLALQL